MIKLTRMQGNLILLVVTIIWGSGFVVTKFCLTLGFSAGLITVIRGAVLTLLCIAFYWKKILKSTRKDTLIGIIAGITNAVAYLLQAIGLNYTTPSTSSFLTIMYIVFVPVAALFMYKKKPSPQMYIAIAVAVLGAAILTGISFGNFTMGLGGWLTLGCAVVFAISLTVIGNSGQSIDTGVMAFWMGVTQVLCSGLYFAFFEASTLTVINWIPAILPLLYTSVIGMFMTVNMQVMCQKATDETTAAIIMSMEALFGSLLSLLFGYDVFSWRLVAGGLLIFSGVLIALIPFKKFLRQIKQKKLRQG